MKERGHNSGVCRKGCSSLSGLKEGSAASAVAVGVGAASAVGAGAPVVVISWRKCLLLRETHSHTDFIMNQLYQFV